MKNYAEELAYWYLRLNGFFPINNYVLHPDDTDENSHADSDILAVKMPHTKETVGLRVRRDYSQELLDIVDGGIRIIGVICEVKGGSTRFSTRNISNRNRIESQVKRLGFFQDDQMTLVINRLMRNSYYENENFKVCKVIICREDNRTRIPNTWNRISLEVIIRYIIRNRLARHPQKVGGWDKFDSSLFQFLIRHRNLFRIPNN